MSRKKNRPEAEQIDASETIGCPNGCGEDEGCSECILDLDELIAGEEGMPPVDDEPLAGDPAPEPLPTLEELRVEREKLIAAEEAPAAPALRPGRPIFDGEVLLRGRGRTLAVPRREVPHFVSLGFEIV